MNNMREMFIDNDEQEISTLGSGYISNFLKTGSLEKGFCTVTNKRVYFKGKSYYKSGNSYKKSNEERIVDLKDITGTGFVTSSRWLLKMMSIIYGILLLLIEVLIAIAAAGTDVTTELILALTLPVIPELIFIVLFLLRKLKLFVISYAGGGIAFLTSDYSMEEMQSFQKALRQAKDNSSANASAVNIQSNSSVADELKKLKDLLDAGAISQDEYESLKAKTLNN